MEEGAEGGKESSQASLNMERSFGYENVGDGSPIRKIEGALVMPRVVLDELGRISLSDLKGLITLGNQTGKITGCSFSLCGMEYKVYYEPQSPLIILIWHDDGEKIAEIRMRKAPSNLGLNSVLYFVCPYTGRSCRKLFTDGSKFFSMYALINGYTYSSRNDSRKGRIIRKAMKEPPVTTNRKLYYRGKLTPFGKRVTKYYRESEENMNNFEIALRSSVRKLPSLKREAKGIK